MPEKPSQFDGGDFLKDKYWNKPEFREATADSARRTEIREGEGVPNKPQERIENYLNRFTEITDREDPEKRERGIAAIERLVEKKYIIKPENISDDYIKNVLLGNEAELLGYEREDVKDEQIKQTVLSSLENKIHSSLDTYTAPAELRESLENMIVTDQKARMKQWLEYLTGEEASHAPAALRYWAFAEMLKQGDYDPVRGEYNKRTDATVAIFPELDQQALAFVFDEVVRKRAGQPSVLSFEDDVQKAELSELLKNENFGKLYAFMQGHVRSLKLPAERLVITEGEWRQFPKGSRPEELTAPLQSFQTKWCIAGEGHASSYLDTSDVWIYFSQDAESKNTIPRACIVDNKERGITEVRGIIFNDEVKQHLDDYITPVVDEKLKEMNGGEKWADNMADMKKLRELHFKHLQKEPLTKEDLTFLYEVDKSIQSSGYGRDPRIAELLKGRDIDEDMPIIFECQKEEIAHSMEEINENTKAYVGQLEPGIFQKLPESLEHIYTSFPEYKIRRENIEIGGKTAKELCSKLDKRNYRGEGLLFEISYTVRRTINSREFIVNKNIENVNLIFLTVYDLKFEKRATMNQIYRRAEEFGLELLPVEFGPHYRLKHQDQLIGEKVYVGMEQVGKIFGDPHIFNVSRSKNGQMWLSDGGVDPDDDVYQPSAQFVFRLRPPSREATDRHGKPA